MHVAASLHSIPSGSRRGPPTHATCMGGSLSTPSRVLLEEEDAQGLGPDSGRVHYRVAIICIFSFGGVETGK